MTIDHQHTRLAFLPSSEVQSLKFLTFPHPRTNIPTQFILHDNQLYECTMVDGSNPHDSQNHLRDTTKGDELPLRSIILTNHDDQETKKLGEGFILEDGVIVVTTKFNFCYFLINYFTGLADKGNSRYESLEDIIEKLSNSYGEEMISQIPESLVHDSLKQITENIIEGDETYYRYSTSVILEYLKSKITSLSRSFPESIKQKLIIPLLQPLSIDEEIPQEILEESLQRHSVFLLSSYLNPSWSDKLLRSYNFDRLNQYVIKLSDEKAKKKLAEEQIHDVNALNAANRREGLGTAKAKTPVKKTAVKVSKGPLDSFFGKKK